MLTGEHRLRTGRRAGRLGAVVVAAALIAGPAACGSDPAPPAAQGSSPATTPAGSGPTTAGDAEVPTSGTTPTSGSSSVDAIGEDGAFPDLGTPDLDVADYELDLDYAPDTGRLDGSATIEAALTRDDQTVELDFQGLDVRSTTVDGDEVDHELTDDKLVLDLGEQRDAGTELTIVVEYDGTPEPVPTDALGGVEVGWHGGTDGSFVLSEPEGASTWFPVNNHPLDKATYTISVTVPEPFTAIANGELVSTTPTADGTTFEWRMDAPMASYLATVVTGEFASVDGGEHDDVTYTYWYAKGIDQSAALEQSDRDVAQLARRLGPFPFTTYGGIVYPPSFINGRGATEDFLSGVALENQGGSLFAEGTTVSSVIIHEAAHQWMGDNVSLTDWSKDIWWIEGFAHFAENIGDVDAMAADYPRVRANWVPPGDLAPDEMFGEGSYECGGMVFYALYREVGEDTFWQILREFNTRYRHANASTDDLVALASEVSGQDLTDFFQAWLFDETPPKLPA